MCGIAGIFSVSPADVNSEQIKKMTATLAHRGPDGENFFFSENLMLALGHRRLAIIDLSDAARQPMNYLSRYTVTCNGEIYNYVELKKMLHTKGYVFRTNSDTEVLLAMYDYKKEKCLNFLDGMFAFAIYDSSEKKLFCARDRFGEKPFYYSFSENKKFVFASEMKAIFAAGIKRSINKKMFYNYLAWKFVHNPENRAETFFENIVNLPPAHYLIIDEALNLKMHRYWDINLNNKNDELTLQSATATFQTLFYDSVSRRLRSDVSLGSCLSGGIDSSSIVAVIEQICKSNKQKTFSARFKNFKRDEGRYIQIMNDKIKSAPCIVFPDENFLVNEIEHIFEYQEEPFLSASVVAQFAVMKLAKENGVKVLLDGQGADEILGGYHFHIRAYFQQLLQKSFFNYKKEWKKYKKINYAFFEKGVKFYFHPLLPAVYMQMEKIKKNLPPQNCSHFRNDFIYDNFRNSFNKKIRSKPDFDFMMYESCGTSLEQILRYADRNSMAHSIEVRLPFLSHELVEFLFSAPAELKMLNGWPKYLLRKSLEEILPDEICWRKDKIGFEPPQQKWLENSTVKEMIFSAKEKLVEENILKKKILNVETANDWNYWMAGKMLQG